MIEIVRLSPATAGEASGLLTGYRDFLRQDVGLGICMGRLEQEIADPLSTHPAPGGLLIARHEGQAAGCVAYHPLAGISAAAELKRLWVQPESRGLGVARALIEATKTIAAGDGYRALYLDTEPDRMAAALALYRSQGFAPCPPYRDTADRLVFLRCPIGT